MGTQLLPNEHSVFCEQKKEMASYAPIDLGDYCIAFRLLDAAPRKRQAFLCALSVSATILGNLLFMGVQSLELFHKGIVIVRRGRANHKCHRLSSGAWLPFSWPNFGLRTDYQINHENKTIPSRRSYKRNLRETRRSDRLCDG